MLVRVILPIISPEQGGFSNPVGMGAFIISLERGERESSSSLPGEEWRG
ncbi:hypothetical protein A2U01_0116449, partial [Trifolium medium]|nr:hypothetical protein [Trifolium medium]